MNDQNHEKQAQIEAVLGAVIDPRTGQPWRDGAGKKPDGPESVHISVRRSGKVHVILELARPPGEAENQLGKAMEAALDLIEGVISARVVLTSPMADKGGGEGRSPPERLKLDTVKDIILVASAKGGVGKSTVAVNLALAAAAKGLRTGLLDADIYGPSLPTMLGIQDQRPDTRRDGQGKTQIIPVQAHGLASLSIGNMTQSDTAMVWRGPMASSALMQLVGEVDWGELDILFVDTPPGTGDILLTLAQKITVSGAVIVTTPQNVALADVRRGISMFEKMQVPLIGLVENMAWFEDREGQRIPIFGGDSGAGTQTARVLGTELLGQIPLHPDIGAASDAGRPIVLDAGNIAKTYMTITQAVLTRLQSLSQNPQ